MKIKTMIRNIVLGCLIIGASLLVDTPMLTGLSINKAEAARVYRPVHHPARPASAAGVARRTTRRVIRRSTIYVASLPKGCSTVVISGSTCYQCGSTYYQAHGTQYVVVYVD